MAQWYCNVRGQQYGPVDMEMMKQWIAEGRIKPDTLCWSEGMANWQPAGQIPALQTELSGGGAPTMSNMPPVQGQMSPEEKELLDKKIVAGVLGIVIGSFGIHKFVLGYTGAGVTMLLVSLLTCGFGASIMGIIGLIEGIMYLSQSDDDFIANHLHQSKPWF